MSEIQTQAFRTCTELNHICDLIRVFNPTQVRRVIEKTLTTRYYCDNTGERNLISVIPSRGRSEQRRYAGIDLTNVDFLRGSLLKISTKLRLCCINADFSNYSTIWNSRIYTLIEFSGPEVVKF